MSDKQKAERIFKRLNKKSNRGFRGYPIFKIAFYGPNNKLATMVKLKVKLGQDEPVQLLSFWEDETDVRSNYEILNHIDNLITEEKIPSVSIMRNIVGCGREECINSNRENDCPYCTYWVGKEQEP